MYWEHFLTECVEPGIEKVCLGFIINYHGYIFITRRRQGDYLQDCFEIPVGLIKPNEKLLDGAKRILKTDYQLDLFSIDYFLDAFTYKSPKGHVTRQFNFVVTVSDIGSLSIDRNDHGLWMCKEEMGQWPLMTVYQSTFAKLWIGEGYDPMISWHLIEQAKRDDRWRYKVRLVTFQDDMVLLLKRSRRQSTYPLMYEFPGIEVHSAQEMDSAIVEAMSEQTGSPPRSIVGYLGFYDYMSFVTHEKVREFFYFIVAQKDRKVHLSTHAYAFWSHDLSFKKVEVTPSVSEGIELLHKRFCLGPTEKMELPIPVYNDPNQSPGSLKLRKEMDAAHGLQEGKIDLNNLKETTIYRKGMPSSILNLVDEIQKNNK